MNKVLGLLTLARYYARGPERPPVGKPEARITHYFTVECADGKRVLAYEQKRGGAVRAARRLDHQEQADDRSK